MALEAVEAEDNAPKGEPITQYVKADLVKQIVEMGFSTAAAEKALFMTMSKGQSVPTAMEWIYEHTEDPDFNEPLLIVGKDGAGDIKKEYQGGLSKEERIKIAEEKIREARARREVEDKKNKHEQEIARIKMSKEIAAAQRIDKEREERLQLELRKKEKQEFNDAKKQMLIQLERDKCERLGIPFDESKAVEAIKKKEQRPPLEEIKHGIKTVKTLYTEDRQPGVAKTCFKTISVYTGNVLKDPNDPKFQ